jgi:hypothetical protein
MSAFEEEEVEISLSGPLAPQKEPHSTTSSSFLSNLFDPSIVDPSYTATSERPPKFAPPSVIMIEEIERDFNGTIGIVEEDNNSTLDAAQYEHDVYFVLVVVTVTLTVLVMVVFAMYRIVESVVDKRREMRAQQRSNLTRGDVPGTLPARGVQRPVPPPAVMENPQGMRPYSVDFLSGTLLFIVHVAILLHFLFLAVSRKAKGGSSQHSLYTLVFLAVCSWQVPKSADTCCGSQRLIRILFIESTYLCTHKRHCSAGDLQVI